MTPAAGTVRIRGTAAEMGAIPIPRVLKNR